MPANSGDRCNGRYRARRDSGTRISKRFSNGKEARPFPKTLRSNHEHPRFAAPLAQRMPFHSVSRVRRG